MTVTGETLLCMFRSKIEDAVSLVPGMEAEEKLKAVQFWNIVSGKLQEIINNSAADIDAVAMSLNESSKKMSMQIECSSNANMASQNGFYTHEFINGATNLIVCGESNPQFLPENLSCTQSGHYIEPSTEGPFTLNCFSDINATLEAVEDIEIPLRQDTNCNGYSKMCSPSCNTPQEAGSPKASFPNGEVLTSEEKVPTKDKLKSKKSNILLRPSTNKLQDLLRSDNELVERENDLEEVNCAIESQETFKVQSKDLEKDSSLIELCNSVECLTSLQSVGKVTESELSLDEPNDMGQSDDYVCDWCDEEFADSLTLHSHRWTHIKPFSCTECDAQFSSKGNLIVHYRKHTGEKPYLCTMCPSKFSTKGNLKRHVKTHSGEKPYECLQCRTRFTEKKSLKVHMRRHTGEKPYICKICGMRFSQSGILQSHMAMHLDEKAHLCEHCGKAFRQKSQLRIHMMRHKGVKNYFCNLCPSKFLTKGDLDRHARTHTGERPFSCSLCKKTFTRQQSLNEHMNRHYGLRPYECKECGKSFFEMSACYKHIKQHGKTESNDKEGGSKRRNFSQMGEADGCISLTLNSTDDANEQNKNLCETEKFVVILQESNEVYRHSTMNSDHISTVLSASNVMDNDGNFRKDLTAINLLAEEASSQELIQN